MKHIPYNDEVEGKVKEALNKRYFKVSNIDNECSFLGRYETRIEAVSCNMDINDDEMVYTRLELLAKARNYVMLYSSLDTSYPDDKFYFAELSGDMLSFIGRYDNSYEAEERSVLLYESGTVQSVISDEDVLDRIHVYLLALLDFSIPLFGFDMDWDRRKETDKGKLVEFFMKLLSRDTHYEGNVITYDLILGDDNLPWCYNSEDLDEYTFSGIELFVHFYCNTGVKIPYGHAIYVLEENDKVVATVTSNEGDRGVLIKVEGEENLALSMSPYGIGVSEDEPFSGITLPVLEGTYLDVLYIQKYRFISIKDKEENL